MTLGAAEPQLFVADVEASLEFFTRKLGFRVGFSYGDPPFYAQVVRDGVKLNLRQVDSPVFDPERREHDRLISATITLDDAPALFVEFQNAGAECAQPLQTEPWGAQTFIVRDPDGNLLLFAS